ncbi:MAG: glutamine amidotransferase [Pseudohongiella sp.]|nr:MAG: glutamine amidotransferase [Pseudohongiella sp.]
MAKPFLIIQLRPEDATADNELAAIKRYGHLKDLEVERLRAEQSGLLNVDLDSYAAIIVGGSPFDISTPREAKSALQVELEAGFNSLLADVVARDFPFLGCCSGNGLLGNYLGATISSKFAEPVGGATIQLSDEGKRDRLLRDFPESFRVLLGHKEACDYTPPGAVLLASNAACPVQMFRVKNNIYATQFHPEADAEGFTVRINIYKDFGYFPAESAEKLIAAVENEESKEAQLLLKRFVDTYRMA